MDVLLEYIDLQSYFSQALPIMLALCLMLLATYYAQNYAGIIDWSLVIRQFPIELIFHQSVIVANSVALHNYTVSVPILQKEIPMHVWSSTSIFKYSGY